VKLEGLGFDVVVPEGWDVQITARARREDDASYQPVVHAGNFPLPNDRGDFGSGAVDVMEGRHVFVSLLEYDPAEASSALFAQRGMPRRLRSTEFGRNRLQRALPGQSGYQKFFNEGGRAFCLYIVLGDHDRRDELLPVAEALLAGIRLSARWRQDIL
jgi:hypothetical protein